jgi:uncharacterized membrane protein YhaH (DUF805 family)
VELFSPQRTIEPKRPALARPYRVPLAGRGTILVLGAVGLGAGLSPLFSGYYGVGVWVPLGLLITTAAGVAVVAGNLRATLPAVLTLAGVTGLGLWSLLSTSWAHGVEAAIIYGNRWLAYAALLLLLVVLIRSERRAQVLLVAAGVGVAIVGFSVLGRMLGSQAASLFDGGRLNSPLGYVNGEGCVFAMGCWGGLALAERREPLIAGLGAAGAVAMACLTLLSQSRGAAIASFAALVVVLLAVPGFRRRVFALAAIGVGVLIAAHSVLKVYSQGGALAASTVHHAAALILIASVVVGIAWAAGLTLVRALNSGSQRSAALGRLATVLSVVLLVSPVIAAVVRHSAIEHTVRTQWHAFVHLSDLGSSESSQTRLLSGGGNRYDYWRVAWHVFLDHPLAGVGAGNYPASYFLARRTTESIQNPHSIELQTLSELGIIGALLLGVALAGVAVGARRLRSTARRSASARTMMVAATGAAVAWFVDTSGDWMHLLPGVTAIALICIAALIRNGGFDPLASERPAVAAGRGLPRVAGIAAVALVLTLTGAGLARAGLARIYLDDARSELAAHAAAAANDAGQALSLDGASLDAYYVKAAAEARRDDAAAARATRLAAAREDPKEFVTWALLGDLEVRLHHFGDAARFYRRASELDPGDTGLAALAADPASALQGGSGR